MIPFILIRVLFVASMVFIIGYVFGHFSRNRTLRTLTKVASILLIVLFIGMNALFFRFSGRQGWRHHAAYGWHCEADSTIHR